MKDREIRNILIEYIKATNSEVRIYQEKSIGNSICDLMAVTDCLTGYEIKSDSDNFDRLGRQITAYNNFFDKNYIIVGETKINEAKQRVPDFWGIVCIQNAKVTVIQEAGKNRSVNRRSQLNILWALELKNLLIKNGLPLFALQNKNFIADKISEMTDPEALGGQIAYELIHRDYSIYNAQDYTTWQKQEIPDLPTNEIIDCLSESDFSQVTLDKWIAIYSRAKELHEEKTAVMQKIPVHRVPHSIPYSDIEVSLGVPWIDVGVYDDFVRYILYPTLPPRHRYNSPQTATYVSYEPITGNWHLNRKRDRSVLDNINATVRFGTVRYNALMIIESTMNLREIRINDAYGKYDEAETLTVLEKQKKIAEEFKDWLWRDDDRKWLVEDAYNRLFAECGGAKFDGSGLKFPEMSDKYTLFDYQKNAVAKIINTPNTLLAFDVGAGKTFIMIAAAMTMRQSGLSRKNMFVVPNSIVGQWEKMFTDIYPTAKVLVVEPNSFKQNMREKVLKQIKNGDYDGIIIAYSCFEMIPLSETYTVNAMNEKIKVLQQAVQSLHGRYGVRQLELEMSRIRTAAQEFLESMKGQLHTDICFDDLEISTLFIDEAHNYKNIPIQTSMKNLNGINTNGSKKCEDLMRKVKAVQKANGGRGVVLATGTPLCNSISDTYAMQMYLQQDRLESLGLSQFDNWVKTFARPEQVCEIDVDTSKFRMIRKFVRFFNLPELSKMFSEVAVFYAMTGVDGLPESVNYSDVIIEEGADLHDYMRELCKRSEKIRSGDIDRTKDNMLKVSTDGRKAALSLELVGKQQPYDDNYKVRRCVDRVVEIYRQYDKCSQLIFCDYSTPKTEAFNIYAELKRRLTEKDIPAEEIAFVHSCRNEISKVKLYEQVNEGKVRILIGSTFKLGIGANVQTRLKAIHHLDVPWRPADMVQREGRIIRRGNHNREIYIYRYIAKGSFDAYSWQILENKQKFISQFLSGSAYQRTADDLENNVLTYAEVKSLALSQPLMKQLTEKENELRRLKLLRKSESDRKKRLEEETIVLERYIAEQTRNARYLGVIKDRIGGSASEKFLKELKPKLTTIFTKNEFGVSPELEYFCRTEYLQFSLCPEFGKNERLYAVIRSTGHELGRIELGQSRTGNVTRVWNFFKNIDSCKKKLEETIAVSEKQLQKMKDELVETSAFEERIVVLQGEYDKLYSIIKMQAAG